MRYIRTQVIITLVGLALVGGLLYFQAVGLVTVLLPAPGGTFVEGVVGAPRQLNPLLASDNQAERDLARLLYDGLIRFDSSGLPAPDLAERWAVTADGLSYTFVLRSGLRWEDGSPLTLDDVIFTIQLMQDPAFPGPTELNALWQTIEVQKLNETTLKLTLSEPFAPFLDFAAFPVLPAHVFQSATAQTLPDHPANLAPVASGPFRVHALDQAGGFITAIDLVANENYYGDAPLLSQLRFVFFGSEAQALEAYQNDEISGLGGLSPAAAASMLAVDDTNVYSGRLPEYTLIYLNEQNEALPFFQEKKVRQALLAGLNRQAIVDSILYGQAFVATGPVLPDTWAYNNNLTAVRFEPQRAAELLDADGWVFPETAIPGTEEYVRSKSGQQLAFSLLVPDDPISQAIGRLAVENWTTLGVRLTLQVAPAESVLSDYLEPRNYEAALVTVDFARSPDPDPYPFWHQTAIEGGQNYGGYNNRDLSEILEQARTINSLADRASFYRAFQARFAEETPALLLFYPVYTYAVDARVRGVQIGPLLDPGQRFDNIADWYVVTRRVIESNAEAAN
ncbi:MAG: peptide ABC transporter substrate-binding protein [Anaerolineales bacterium]